MKRIVSGIMLTLLLTSMLTFAINIQQVNASYFFNSMGPVLKSKEKHIAISFPKPIIAKIGRYDWPKIENCSYLTNPGQPTLPVKSVVVKLPEKSNITNIEVKVKETLLQGSFSILPVPSPTTLDSQIPGKISEDPTIYQANSFFPKEWYVCHEAHGIDAETTTRVKYLILNLFPLRFLPVENKLIQAEKISITVTYVESPEILTPSAELKNLIITSPTLEQYAIELAEWKNDTGISSKTVNTTWIYTHYGGVDNQEKIRNCIKDFVATYGIIYVTIFGDADQVPVRYVYVPDGVDTYTPTDLYYADLDGTWDDNGDGLYADQRYDEVDGIPDVYIGRIPPSLIEYAQVAVDKIIGYQKQFRTSQDWTRRIVLAAGTGHNGVEDPFGIAFPFLKDYIANITTDKDVVKLYESAGNLSTASMASEINEGALFVNFAGHGDPGTGLFAVGWLFYWVIPGLWWNGFGISDVQSLTNGFKLPVVTTMACSTARFDDTDCIGEWFVLEPDGGSIAYFGATRVAYGWPEEMSPYGFMGEMDRRIYENFYEGYTRLGQMWGEAISEYVQSHIWNYEYASVYDVKTFMEYVLLGDPTLRICNPDYPETLNVPEDYPTIQEAINAACLGDTIQVAPGAYDEHIVVNKTLNVVGSGKTSTSLESVRISANDVSISGFYVKNSTEGLWSWPFGIVVDGADSCTIEWNFIEYGVNLAYSNYTRIQHNAIEGQIIMGSPFDGGGIGGGVNNTVADNDINAEVWPFGCGNFRFCNNTFRGELSVEGSSALIENNHFIGASLDLWTSTADIHNNTIERGGIYIPGKLGSSGSIIGNRICNYGGTAIHSTMYGDMVNSLFIIKQNYICNNTCGIDASGLQSGSIIYENILQENDVGIKIHSVFEYWPTGDPHIYHNDFIQSQQQVSLWGFYTTPSWNDSYPSGGNYWSGYAGVDFYSGPNQDQLGSDGIGDTPYIIDASNQDNYPLMNPYCGARVRFYTMPSSSDFGITYQGRSYHDGETDVFECGTSGPAYASCLDDWCWEFYFWDPTGGVNVDPVWDPSTTVTILGDGTLCAIFEGRLFDIFLNSSEADGSTSYLGTIIFDGEPCPLWEIHRTCGIYSVEYIPAPGYVFDYWEAWGCVGLINDSTVIVEPVNPPDIPPYATGGLTAYYRESEDYFDLGTPSSPVASGYIGVNEASLYASGVGYGWIDAPSLDSRDRGAPDDLRRDLVCSRNDATFCVDLSDGDYTVTLIIGDASYTQDMIDVHAEGVLVVDDLTVFKGAFQEISFVVTVADGHLNLRFHNDGGRSTHWVCNAITIEPTAFYTVHLESVENTGETSNLGYITFDGSSYALPSDSSKAAGSYEVSFTADGYVLDHWETSGGVSVSRSIVTVIGDGTLRAVYKVAPAGWYFDLGTPSSPVASGYVGVNETTLYDSSLGYGWINAPSLDSRDRGAPDDLRRDLCCSRQDATFWVDIPNGVYTVTLIIGDNSYTQDLIDVYCEDILVVNDLTVLKGTFQEISFTVTVDDGQLNLRFHNDGGISTHWVCNAITIETPSTLYNVHLESIEDTSATSSLGSIFFDGQSYTLPADLSKPEGTYEISYIAALGYVFDHWETSGDVSISGSALTITGDGILTAVYRAVEGWYFDLGTPSSPVEPGYIGVNETTLYDVSLGYGWVNAPGLDSRDRGSPDDLRRDFVCSRNDATFNVDVPDGDYTVTLIVGDGAYTQDMIDVYAEGVLVINDLTAQKGTFQEVSFTATVTDGQLNLTFHNDGGISTNWVSNAIVVRSLGIIRVPQDYLTIQEAIDNASSGDTILVSPGNYKGFIFRGYTNSITLIGTNRNATIINGTVGFDIHGYSTNHKLINFTVRNGGVHISAEEMVGLDVINNTITDCDVGISAWGSSKGHYENIVNNTVVGNNVGIEYSGVGTHSPYPKIVGNHVSNNSVIGVYLSGHWDHTPLPEFWGNNITNNGAGIYVTGFTSGTISENLISNNDDYGLCVDSSFGISVANNSITNNGFGIQGSSEGFGGKISGNIITNNTFDGINLHWSSATIENNTITHNGAAGVWMYDSSGTITRNLISDNDDNGVFMDTGIHDSGSIKQNIITNNEGDGINLAGDVIVISNTIWNNLNGVRCCETSNEKGPKVNFNDIYENEKWNLIADPWAAPYDGSVNATYNWWGTTNQTLIEQGVSGNVTFIPYLWNSISSEDFLPPSIQNVELSPSNPSYHMDVNVTAKVKDNVMVDSVIFSYRANSEWSNVTMEQSEELFQTSIPKQPLRNHTGSTVEPQWETTAFFLYRGLRCSLRLF